MQRIINDGFVFQYAENRKDDLIVYVYKINKINENIFNDSVRDLKEAGVIENDFYDELFLYSKDHLLQTIENYSQD